MSFNIGIDHDPVIICPYDGNHKIAKSRIQRHLVKCEKNFPPNYKKQCPYDATHRVFEYELVNHVKDCPSKYTCPIDIGQSLRGSSDIVIKNKNDITNDEEENWDKDLPDVNTVNNLDVELVEQSSEQKSKMFVVKHYGSKLRRPFGYSESLMLETSYFSTDEDVASVTSDMGIGRGRSIAGVYSGQYQRGTNHSQRQGIRGRLLR